MKYKQIKGYEEFNGRLPEDILDCILKSRGVVDVNRLMNVNENEVLDPYLLRNMDRAIELILFLSR